MQQVIDIWIAALVSLQFARTFPPGFDLDAATPDITSSYNIQKIFHISQLYLLKVRLNYMPTPR